MFAFYFLFFAHFSFIYSPPPIGQLFTRSIFYQSLSNPGQILELRYNFPTSPIYLKILVKYEIDLLTPDFKRIVLHSQHHFKRVDGPYTSSIVFTTMGNRFTQMRIGIFICNSLIEKKFLTTANYQFGPGFKPGQYELVDISANFGIMAQVLDTGSEYIQMKNDDEEDAIAYLRTVTWEDEEICLISENFHPVVIRPHFMGKKPDGPITQVVVDGFKGNTHAFWVVKAAFWCHSEEGFSVEPVVFMKEKSDEIKIQFRTISAKSDDVFKEEISAFSLRKINWVSLEDSSYLPQELSKMDFSNTYPFIRICPDGSKQLYFSSKSGFLYKSEQIKLVQISPFVKFFQHTRLPQMAACSA